MTKLLSEIGVFLSKYNLQTSAKKFPLLVLFKVKNLNIFINYFIFGPFGQQPALVQISRLFPSK